MPITLNSLREDLVQYEQAGFSASDLSAKITNKRGGEKKFIRGHEVEVTDHPVATKAQFSGEIQQDFAARPQDKKNDELGMMESANLAESRDLKADIKSLESAANDLGVISKISSMKDAKEDASHVKGVIEALKKNDLRTASKHAKNVSELLNLIISDDTLSKLGIKEEFSLEEFYFNTYGVSLMENEVVEGETVFEQLKVIAENDTPGRIRFYDDTTERVETSLAETIVSAFEHLTEEDANKIDDYLSQDKESFQRIVNTALKSN